ncbi:hypothetical protein ADM98_05475 [Exiguobacterium sp. BMC-KP]|uniref:sce7725 family protein n=1 Tax=Exiguobacterium sp. BMC-KP TaxID=1684312 RepID=UPI0006AA1440|nr:sce7725 family protein [Exiguobacterium sp. BMC-KP]KOP30892.1 hypothetical protein ADM98_05475 [Exiguobacterium sp. BMC-KP]
MYFPIIRGRQYDLIALRELKERNLISKKIVPIIEPIKFSSTLISLLSIFFEKQSPIVFITNPKIGSFKDEIEIPSTKKEYQRMISENEFVRVGHYLNKKSKIEIEALLEEYPFNYENFAIIHSSESLDQNYSEIFKDKIPYINVIPYSMSLRRKLRNQNLVAMSDKFNKMSRNSDYLENPSEEFSVDHLFFEEEGYIGFSDYSVVGSAYAEGGFAPYAVAIHIVYPNKHNEIEIMHFVSDSNKDTSDAAGKFSEALNKLMDWYTKEFNGNSLMDTYAMRMLSKHYYEGTYPGLPTLKKLSIMHHLELVDKLLNLEEEDELL